MIHIAGDVLEKIQEVIAVFEKMELEEKKIPVDLKDSDKWEKKQGSANWDRSLSDQKEVNIKRFGDVHMSDAES